MNAKISQFCCTALISLVMLGCGGEPTIEDVVICQTINNSTYVSEDLFMVNRSDAKGHWRVDLKDYDITSFQSDFVLSGRYTCEFGEVKADLQSAGTQEMLFSDNYQTLTFSPLGGDPVQYKRVAQPNTAEKSCDLVKGNSYKTKNLAAATNTNKLANPGEYYELMTFAEDGSLRYTIGGDAFASGQYDCELGLLALYADDKKFAEVSVSNDGSKIKVSQAEFSREYFIEEQSFCTQEFAPVCAVKPQNIQCLVAPCPVGIHKTYSNTCYAEQDKAKILFKDACGELEDTPYFEPVVCTKEFAPICGGVTTREPCDTIPCPAIVHKTFGNKCELNADNALHLFEGECGKLEGEPVKERQGVACPAIFDPVCGKDEAGIVCVTAPCPTHDYATFGNSCEAGAALATVVKSSECGTLEGVLAFGQPPVQMVEEFPKILNPPTVTKASITDDVLTVALTYSACGPLHHNMLAGKFFFESNPVQAEIKFQPVLTEFCKAVAQDAEFSYDLLPLKHEYLNAYQTKTGKIILRGLDLIYEF